MRVIKTEGGREGQRKGVNVNQDERKKKGDKRSD